MVSERMRRLQESMGGLEGIEALMDDTEETRAEWEEISQALVGTLNVEEVSADTQFPLQL